MRRLRWSADAGEAGASSATALSHDAERAVGFQYDSLDFLHCEQTRGAYGCPYLVFGYPRRTPLKSASISFPWELMVDSAGPVVGAPQDVPCRSRNDGFLVDRNDVHIDAGFVGRDPAAFPGAPCVRVLIELHTEPA